MIIRDNQIRASCNEVKLAVCFGIPDIRRFVKMFIEQLTNNHDPDLLSYAKSATFTEQEVRHWLEHHPFAFGWIEKNWRIQLSAWCWYHLVHDGFVIPSATKDDAYIFADSCFTKIGRPKES